MYLKLAARNILRNRSRTLLTLLVMATGIVAMILARGFITDTVQQYTERTIRSSTGHLRIYRQGYLEDGLLHPYDYMIDHPDDVIARLRREPHVVAVGPRLSVVGLASNGETTIPFSMQTIDPELDQSIRSTIEVQDGSFLVSGDDFGVLVGKGLARVLGAKRGDNLVLLSNTQRGAMNAVDVTVKGICSSGFIEFDNSAIFATTPLAKRLLHTEGIQMIFVFLDETRYTDVMKHSVEKLLTEINPNYRVQAWYETDKALEIRKMLAVYTGIFRIAKWIIVIVVMLGIANTMNMAVLERVGEVGTLMALGTRKEGILKLFLAEGFLLGIFGGLIGCVLGCALGWLLSRVGIQMPTPPGYSYSWIARIAIAPKMLWPPFLIVVLTSLASSAFPALKASRLEIAEALRHNI
jgi:putative ABC transport system permease protein